MRYFVTGGTGVIGSHLVRQLLAGGHEVVAFVAAVKAYVMTRWGQMKVLS